MRRREASPSSVVLARQRSAAEQLRREVFGADGSLRHPYFRDLRRQLRSYEQPAARRELHEAARDADVVFVGDFHAVPQCQHFAAELLSAMADGSRDVGLGVEFIYTRQQRQLDRRQAGLVDDATFLRRIHYREEWGYPWTGFRALLDRARDLGVPVHALDVPPRGGFDGLRRRDAHAARRIVHILEEHRGSRLIVLFGESHVSAGHIPRRLRALAARRAGLDPRIMTVFQDPDRLYWESLSASGALPESLRVSGDTWAVFHGSPLAKYEAYRQILERWGDDVPPDEEVDLTPAVHHLIGVLLDWLEIHADRYRLHHRAGWSEDLEDAFPEVFSGPEALALLAPILEEHRRTPEEILEAADLLGRRGVLYESRSNTLFLSRYLPSLAAFEGARFLRAALSERLFDPPEEKWEDPVAQAYGAAYNEGLALLGARLVDPTGEVPVDDEQRVLAAGGGSSATTQPGVAERVKWIEAHRRFEEAGGRRPPSGLIEPLRRSRLIRRALARDLGRRLGEALFERVRNGVLDGRGLRRLFRRRLSPDGARRIVLHLLRNV